MLLKPLLTLNVLLCGQKIAPHIFEAAARILPKPLQHLCCVHVVETKVVNIFDKILDLIAFVKTIHCLGEILLRALSPPWMAGPPMGMLGA